MMEKKVIITNPIGLQARMAALFVQTAGKFTSAVWVNSGDRQVNAKSIMGLMSLGASPGSAISIGAEGEDETLAVKELIELLTMDINT